MTAVRVLREAGYIVNRVIAIVDRMDNHDTWAKNNLEYHSLFLLDEVAHA